MKFKQTHIAISGVVLIGLGLGQARAETPAWPSEPYAYVVVDQDLRTVLSEFGSNMNVRMVLSDAVQGRVRGRLPALAPAAFLDHLAQSYGLDWYFDGMVLSVSASSETVTHFVPLHGLPFAKLQNDLARSGLLDHRFGLKQGPGPDVVMVSGPPRYAQQLEQSIAVLTAAKAPEVPGAPRGTLVIYRGSAPPSRAPD
jgi:type III secretion protein C